MDNSCLELMRESAIQLIRNCEDTDLLDLLCKVLLESGVNAACE